MSGAVHVALAAAIGNFLQGWDNAAIAGAILYIKGEFDVASAPKVEGLIVAMSLIGAVLVTTCSGVIADRLGRRPLLIVSSLFYFLSGFIMLWSPNIYILLLGRLIDGFGIGLAVTIVPVYISETSPAEVRGLLNTLPQFSGCLGMFLSYCMVFGMSFMDSPNWRLMLAVLSIPSIVYIIITAFYLPESPRWLVSKGRLLEAKNVLRTLRGREDVSGELAMLVEGLGVGGEISIEKYIICPGNEPLDDDIPSSDQMKLYGLGGLSWTARTVNGQTSTSRQESIQYLNTPLVDPLVGLFANVNDKLPDIGSKGSMFFPHLGSMFSVAGNEPKHEEWDEENVAVEGEDYVSDAGGGDSDEDLQSPLISRQTTEMEKDMGPPPSHGTMFGMPPTNLGSSSVPENDMGIGGGWQLAWNWMESKGPSQEVHGAFRRVFFLTVDGIEARRGSFLCLPVYVAASADSVQATALVSQPALYPKDLKEEHLIGPAMIHPCEAVREEPCLSGISQPGVKHALFLGVGIQLLQQLSGINGVLYYTPQILEEAGVGVVLSEMGISSNSASFLISGITALLMLPSIAVAMRLADFSGRRSMLLSTIPALIVTLIILLVTSVVNIGSIANAAVSTVCVMLYFCFFVVGFGPIPNIICSEIFPTRVRGTCVAICALGFWIGDAIVTYTLPLMLSSIGLPGVFGVYAVMCAISFVFVFLKVPETRGMPLEVISEFFSLRSKQDTASKIN